MPDKLDQLPNNGKRILVVDDERIQRLIISHDVGALGHATDSAATLDEAAALLARQPYDAVLLDLFLGESEGISLLQAVRNSQSEPAIIFVSGLDDRVRAASIRLAEAWGLRVAGSIGKPVSRDVLAPLLEALPCRRDTRSVERPHRDPTAEELIEALDLAHLTVAYQPKISLRSGAVVGVEALARWPHPVRTLIPPSEFIPLAERSGLIKPLTLQILRQALEACRRWQTTHPCCSVAVNVSPLVLADPALPEEIDDLLHATGLHPSALIAEITESTVIANPLIAAEVLTRLRIKGVNLSIDDFGTGHSSLIALHRLPFSELKIDRSFVGAADHDIEAVKIVRATVSMARELGLRVVGEGIENEAQEAILRTAGCDIGQGWLFARPMPEADFVEWLRLQPTIPA